LKEIITNTNDIQEDLKSALKLHEISQAKNDPSIRNLNIRKEPYPSLETN